MRNLNYPILGLILFVALSISAILVSTSLVAAQESETDWSPLINLSQSGSTINPVVVQDETGVIHVIWQDEISGFFYTQYFEGEWTEAIQVDFQRRRNAQGIAPVTKPRIPRHD